MPETTVRQRNDLFPSLRLPCTKDVPDVAFLAHVAAAVKHLVTVFPDHLVEVDLVGPRQGLVGHHDSVVAVIDDQRVGDAVQDPVQERFLGKSFGQSLSPRNTNGIVISHDHIQRAAN